MPSYNFEPFLYVYIDVYQDTYMQGVLAWIFLLDLLCMVISYLCIICFTSETRFQTENNRNADPIRLNIRGLQKYPIFISCLAVIEKKLMLALCVEVSRKRETLSISLCLCCRHHTQNLLFLQSFAFSVIPIIHQNGATPSKSIIVIFKKI